MLRVVFEESSVVIEGGISGRQQRLVCPNCGKIFFAWRPDELPGVKVKCYYCKHEFADDVALRVPAPAPAPAAVETPLADAATAETPAGPAEPPSSPTEPAPES
jgi:hypothetical protein